MTLQTEHAHSKEYGSPTRTLNVEYLWYKFVIIVNWAVNQHSSKIIVTGNINNVYFAHRILKC
jgi:hypothetical protein